MSTKFYYKTTKYLYPPNKTSLEAVAYKLLFSNVQSTISSIREKDGDISPIEDPFYRPGAPGLNPYGIPDADNEIENLIFQNDAKVIRIWRSLENAQDYVNAINAVASAYIRAELADEMVSPIDIPEEYRAY